MKRREAGAGAGALMRSAVFALFAAALLPAGVPAGVIGFGWFPSFGLGYSFEIIDACGGIIQTGHMCFE